jgi:hypothetical protein
MGKAITLLFIMSLLACASTSTGAYLPSAYDSAVSAIAYDAASKLALEYPPDEHALELRAQTEGSFDRAFVSSLRQSGFALSATEARAGEALVLQYAVDQLRGTKLVRVTLFLEHRTLSRAYTTSAEGVYPAGPWSSGVHRGS